MDKIKRLFNSIKIRNMRLEKAYPKSSWRSRAAVFVLVTFFLFGSTIYVYNQTDRELSDVPNKLIRLHVVANSDSPEDQALKREVRDRVIKQMSPKFEGLTDINEVKKIINDNLTNIEDIAKEVIKEKGKDYAVKAALGEFQFPTKVYGNLTLPAGVYQALKIVIGSGEGQNWWCVMFPPLCFIDIAHGVTPEATTIELKKVLSQDEYNLLLSAKTEKEIPVKLKFKLFEIAKSVNARLAGK